MKNLFTLLVLMTLGSANLVAQNAMGCDGSRYMEDIYDDISVTTVQYGANVSTSGNDTDLLMDIYQPVGDDQEQRPVIIFAHGGSFIFGDRSLEEGNCRRWAKKGFVTASIDYRLWQFAGGLPDSLDIMDVVIKAVGDMKASVRYFRQDAATANEYKIDPNYIFVGGLSAGAVTALHVSILDETDEGIPDFMVDAVEDNGGIEGTSGNEGYSSETQGVIGMSGGIYKLSWIDESDAPVAMMHGTADGTVPYDHGLAADIMSLNGSGFIASVAPEANMLHYLKTIPGGGHTDIYGAAYVNDFEEYVWGANLFMHNNVLCPGISVGNIEISPLINQVNISPNPADEMMTISIDDIDSNYDVDVFDSFGRLVTSLDDMSATQFNLYAGEIGKGMFLVQLKFRDQQFGVITKKVMFH